MLCKCCGKKEMESKVRRLKNVCMLGHDEIVNGMVRLSLTEKVTFKQSFEKGKGGRYVGIWERVFQGEGAVGQTP